jgi:CheY-like chemotaxis protein
MRNRLEAQVMNARATKPLRILVVDDDIFLAHFMAKCLEHHGFDCLSVVDQSTFIEAIEGGFAPDLVVTDLHIQSESGCDILKYVRSKVRFRDIPVLLISSDRAGPKIAADHKFSSFLPKDNVHRELVARIHQLISR